MAKNTQYNNEKRIAIFKNAKYTAGSNLPLYTGVVTIGGVNYYISLWGKMDQQGQPYFQGQVRDEREPIVQEMDFVDQTDVTTAKKTSKKITISTKI